MASRGWRRPLASLPALALALLLLAVAAAAAGSPDRTAPSRPPLVLPLTLSYPNASRVASSRSRRGLAEGGHPSARMRLHDDLLTNGYYTTRLYIGTPPQEFALIVDSGSTVTYVPCASCEQCGNHQDPRFQPDLSSTYSPVKCNVDCNCNSDKSQCTYERQYAEMSSSSGVLGEDIVSFGTESELKPQRAVFGCENSETGDLFSQHADGIMGLGRGQLSIMDQLVDKGVIGDSFSMCYGGMDIGGGAMVLGAMPGPPDMVYTHSNAVRSPYYNIELKEIHVAGKPLRVDPRIFDGKHGTVLDSGTTYAYLPEQAFVAFKDAGNVSQGSNPTRGIFMAIGILSSHHGEITTSVWMTGERGGDHVQKRSWLKEKTDERRDMTEIPLAVEILGEGKARRLTRLCRRRADGLGGVALRVVVGGDCLVRLVPLPHVRERQSWLFSPTSLGVDLSPGERMEIGAENPQRVSDQMPRRFSTG
ncbi:unnamed protein product [Triticum turgidum subsp. durum]|uniref:Peptidase A1 domain-containing protein n=1 Tax=Triticum turgidum subsp. durum TaxID=4567 RepID=A0A9R1RK45_TRITD|nr:unnamed protein product [Triticum turgidum subsp. durum]